MKCKKCKKENPEGEKTCENCGSNLEEQKKVTEQNSKILSICSLIFLLLGIILLFSLKLINFSKNVTFLEFFVLGISFIGVCIVPFLLSLFSKNKVSKIKVNNRFINFVFWCNTIILIISIIIAFFSVFYCGYTCYDGCKNPGKNYSRACD